MFYLNEMHQLVMRFPGHCGVPASLPSLMWLVYVAVVLRLVNVLIQVIYNINRLAGRIRAATCAAGPSKRRWGHPPPE